MFGHMYAASLHATNEFATRNHGTTAGTPRAASLNVVHYKKQQKLYACRYSRSTKPNFRKCQNSCSLGGRGRKVGGSMPARLINRLRSPMKGLVVDDVRLTLSTLVHAAFFAP
jgi:hypothetical protein